MPRFGSSSSPPLQRGARLAAVTSMAMIAQQVAGKAARDGMFLSNFSIGTLPATMASSAVLSIVAALWLSRMITRHSPAAVVPLAFGASSAAFLVEWALSFSSPRLAAVALYLHTTLFGAAVLSAFWSLINETFDPHSGKRASAWIAGGGTLGGVLGGLAAWRASLYVAPSTMLLLLAATNLCCALGSHLLRGLAGPRAALEVEGTGLPLLSSFHVLRGSPYLRKLSIVVTLGAITAGLLDYILSAEAVKVYARGPELLSFFAFFGLVVSAFSFVLQILLGRIALEKLGLVITLALLPGFVVLGGAFGLLFPGLWSTAVLRAGEAAQRNSLFRAAYEMLYTPLSEEKKRSAKTLIDVAFDRLGTMTAGGIAMLVPLLAPRRTSAVLLCVGVACALVALLLSRPLHLGYVAVLEESLLREAEKQAIRADTRDGLSSRELFAVRDEIVDKLELLSAQRLVPTADEPSPETSAAALEDGDLLLGAVIALRSGDPRRARAVLSAEPPLAPPLVSFVIPLLADKELQLDAIRALRKIAKGATGQLVDALCDPGVLFDLRRRIPRILSVCPTQRAADGLVWGTEDERFEVRYECGRALLHITASSELVVIPLEQILTMVKREVEINKAAWQGQPALQFDDDDESQAPALVDRLLRDRLDRSLEYVFGLLALHLDRASLRIAFKALHHEEERLRGTALEYLETVLPVEIRDAVWPFLGESRPMRAARSAQEILEDLVRAVAEGAAGPIPAPEAEASTSPSDEVGAGPACVACGSPPP